MGRGTVLPVRRALLSVADKRGLVGLGRGLAARGVALVSSGSTAGTLLGAGLPVTTVSEVTGVPEMLDGRVKTLHPRIHAGILADKEKPAHLAELEAHAIDPFDLVVVNLYPFREAVAGGAPWSDALEQIDIGGPTLLRAGAKNFRSVGVVVRPDEYDHLLQELDRLGGLSESTRLGLATEAFGHVAAYDQAIASWFAEQAAESEAQAGSAIRGAGVPDPGAVPGEALPRRLAMVLVRRSLLRYGENPHQRGALYASEDGPGPLGGAEVLQSIDMSYINWLDARAARDVASAFDRPAAAIIKHENPCGAAVAPSPVEAYLRALEGDRISAFGGVVGYNREVDEEAAEAMAGVLTHVVVAPSFTPAALSRLGARKNLRVVRAPLPRSRGLEVRPIEGGALVHDADSVTETTQDMKVMTGRQPTEAEWADLLFAWRIAARVRSNAIVLARDEATVGVGAGQMNRLYSVDIAARHAGHRGRGSCLASDAFFPFRDAVDRAARAGVAAIIQPGGAMRDEEVIASAEEHGMALVFTGRRHFRH